jgi:transposase
MAATKSSGVSRVVIGVDPHKRIDAVVVLDETAAVLAREVVPHTSAGFRALMVLARRFPQRVWAVEGCNGVGKNLAHRLVAVGETVLDVSTRKSSLVRALATNSGRKTDDTDAYSIALVGLRSTDLPVVVRDEQTELLRLLSGRRRELVGLRTQAVCRLHRELVILIPGGASRRLTATRARALLNGVRPRDEVERLRKQLARDQLVDLLAIDKRLAAINTEIRTAVRATGTSLTDIFGIGSVNAAMVLGEVGQVARFATRHHFAAYNGTAPAQWGSGGDIHDRVNLGGNRRLNHAVHIAAITQARYPGPGRDFYQRKRVEAKTAKEALRALKRRISDSVYRQLVADAKADEGEGTGPGGQVGAALSSSAANRSPVVSTSDRPQPGPVTTDPTPAAPAAGRRSSARSRRPRNAPTRRRRQAQSA